MKTTALAVLLVSGPLLAQPGSAPPGGQPGDGRAAGGAQVQARPQSAVEYTVEPVVEGLEVPWDFAWLPDGRMVITERPGRVRIFEDGALRPEPLLTVDGVFAPRGAENGLMSLCLHPRFAENRLVYLSYGHQGGGERDVRVVRYVMEGDKGSERLREDKVIMQGAPAGGNHAGCRVRFGPDGKLYITTGEMFQRQLAQDMGSLGGKVLRVNDDGAVPADNPFVGKPGARGEIWTVGNRNPQGIDWQPGTGLLFETEHGPSGENGRNADEFNRIEKGRNYGWPIIKAEETQEGLESPLHEWTPAIAPASGAFYTGDLFPQWKGRFMVGALGGLGRPTPGVVLITIKDSAYGGEEWVCTDLGRIRNVATGPDGAIYFSTSNKDGRGRPREGDDRIMRIVPKK
jgi:glucose/arabinose dehydrogenase